MIKKVKPNLESISNEDLITRDIGVNDLDVNRNGINDGNVYFEKSYTRKGFFGPISNQYHKTLDLIVKNKGLNLALVTGTVTSVGFNILSSYYADKHGFDTNGIEWISYGGETFAHSAISAATFLYFSKKAGKSFKNGLNELLFKITPVTALISVGPYRLARNGITDYLLSNGMPPEGATPLAQLALLIPYAVVVNYALKLVDSYIVDKNNSGILNKNNSPLIK